MVSKIFVVANIVDKYLSVQVCFYWSEYFLRAGFDFPKDLTIEVNLKCSIYWQTN